MGATVSILSRRQDRITERLDLVRPIALSIHRKLRNVIEVEDLISHGFLGLVAACDNHDESKGPAFDFYARVKIRGAMLDAVRRECFAVEIDGIDRSDPAPLQDSRFELTEALASLPARQREVLDLRLRGMSYTDIAGELGISRPSVKSLECRAIASIRKLWSGSKKPAPLNKAA